MFKNLNKNINFIKEILSIKFKALNEYKINFHSANIVTFFYYGFFIISFLVLKKNFSEIFYWDLSEFVFFITFSQMFYLLHIGFFRKLPRILINGDFNEYLIRPINPVINYSFSTASVDPIMTFFLYIIIFIIGFIWLIPFYFNKFIISLIFGFLIGFLTSSCYFFIDSIAFYLKEIRYIKYVYDRTNNYFNSNPIIFFQNNKIFPIFIFLGNSFYGCFTTLYYFNDISFIDYFLLIFCGFILTLFFFYLGNLNWKYGIKKYEGYN